MNSAEPLLARLEGVRKSGNGWVAKCPSHQDRTASLSVREGDDGKTLVHCFAGCSALDVVESVGLELADLFPQPIRDQSPAGKAERRQAYRESGWAAALGVLRHESGVVLAAIGGGPLQGVDRDRLAQAVERIESAREVLTP